MNLNFEPKNKWPDVLPPIEWRGVRLCGWNSRVPAVDRSQVELIDLIAAIYPSLALSELSRFYQLASGQIEIDWTEFFKKYGFRDSEDLHTTLRKISELSREFQNWIDEKSLGLRDLAPLRQVTVTSSLRAALQKILELKPGKSEGTRAIELISELALLEKLPDCIAAQTWQDFSAKLFSLRYPNSTLEQTKSDLYWNPVSWPAGVQTSLIRKGDKAGVEVKYFARTKEELAAKSRRLAELLEGNNHD